MEHTNVNTAQDPNTYDIESVKAGWDSPKKAQELVKDFINEGAVVLDIGTGTGLSINGYAEKGARIIAIDNDSEMLDKASALVGDRGEVRISDINTLMPLSDLQSSVDVAQAIGVLEFADDIDSVFEQVYSALRPGGVFVFTIESSETENTEFFPESDVTVYRHSGATVVKQVENRGFTIISDASYTGYRRGEDNHEVPYQIFLIQK